MNDSSLAQYIRIRAFTCYAALSAVIKTRAIKWIRKPLCASQYKRAHHPISSQVLANCTCG